MKYKVKEKLTYENEQIKNWLLTNNSALMKAIIIINEYQLPEEQSAKTSLHNNNLGFNKYDAPILMFYADKIKRYKGLYKSEIDEARRRMLKYSKQLTNILNEKDFKENGRQMVFDI